LQVLTGWVEQAAEWPEGSWTRTVGLGEQRDEEANYTALHGQFWKPMLKP